MTKTTIRASEVETDRWQAAAKGSKSFNQWAVRALNEQAALDEALRRQQEKEQNEGSPHAGERGR